MPMAMLAAIARYAVVHAPALYPEMAPAAPAAIQSTPAPAQIIARR